MAEAPEINFQKPGDPVFYLAEGDRQTVRSNFSLFDSDLVTKSDEGVLGVSGEVEYKLSDDRFELQQYRPGADIILYFEDGRDQIRFSADIGQIWVQSETVGQSENLIIRSSGDHTASDNFLAVIYDFDGAFDSNDLYDGNVTVTSLPDIS